MTLKQIKRLVKPGAVFLVTNHLPAPDGGTVRVTVGHTGGRHFWLIHPLGESKVYWPAARYVSVTAGGVIELRGWSRDGHDPDALHLTLAPAAAGR